MKVLMVEPGKSPYKGTEPINGDYSLVHRLCVWLLNNLYLKLSDID